MTWWAEHIAYVINSCKNLIHKTGKKYVTLGIIWVDEMIILKSVLEEKDNECGSDPSHDDWV